MKLYKTLIFIFALLAILAGISLTFPKEGIQIGSMHLSFPSLRQVLSFGILNDEDTLSPEELIDQEKAALMQAKDSAFLDFCYNSPIRISMPFVHELTTDTLSADQYLVLEDSVRQTYDSIVMTASAMIPTDTVWVGYRDVITDKRQMDYLDDFFASLDSARSHHVRIMHYGDSQIEEDRITSGLRERFQARFGGGGCGMMPAQTWVTKLTCFQKNQPELSYHVAYGSPNMRAKHNNYGPMATVAYANGNVKISYSMVKNDKFPHVRDFDRVSILRDSPDGSGLQYVTRDYDTLQQRVTLNVAGPAQIYGVLLDQKTGVSMDNVPMRGSSGNIFTTISRKTIEPFFAHENVRLIILQYGGNSVPGLRSEESLINFCKDIQRQIRLFNKLAPEAEILFIGPSDMSTRIDGLLQTYPHLPHFVELLEQYVTAAGAAFWNLYEAMGGENSMIQWVKARPQLAGEDYIHFTHRGAEHVSDLLYETIDTYYKYYKFRNGELIEDEPIENEDSISTLDPVVTDSVK